jgi:tetratricopeptide (TPR) repeat protein
VGELPPGRLSVLAQRRWLELEDLLTASQASQYYTDPSLTPLFYSQSWALTHMLILSDQYRPKGSLFLDAVLGGEEAVKAIPRVYGRSLQQVKQDLAQYAGNSSFRVLVFPSRIEKPEEKPEIRPATPLEWGMVQADVLAGGLQRRQEANAAYQKLTSEFPKSWQPHAGLAYLALMAGDSQSALDHFARADELGCDEPKVYVDYARMAFGRQEGSAVKLLERALELKPDSQETVYQLSMTFYYAREYRKALEAMARMKSVDADQAAELFSTMAISAHFTGDERMAANAAARAIKEARNDEERKAISSRLEVLKYPAREGEFVWQPEPPAAAAGADGGPPEGIPSRPIEDPPPYVEGVLVQVDCIGESVKLWVQSDAKKLSFLIPVASKILVLRGGQAVIHEFECGPQKDPAKVTVRYRSGTDTPRDVEGLVQTLELR